MSTSPIRPESKENHHHDSQGSAPHNTNKRRRKEGKKTKPQKGQTNHPWMYRFAIPELTAQEYTIAPQQMYGRHAVQVRGFENDEPQVKMHLLEDALVTMLRRGYRYTWCVTRKSLPNLKYTATDLVPYCARFSYEERSTKTFLSENAMVTASNEGFRSVRANVMVREGDWFYEAKILRGNEHGAHVRIGFTRREAELESPVGADGYGYGFRDANGAKVHFSRPKPFMNEPFKTGDVLGLRIFIPRGKHFKGVPIYRDRYPLKKRSMYFEAIDYVSSKPMTELLTPVALRNKTSEFTPEVIPGSWIRVYKNGRDMGIAFEDLLEFMPPCSEVLKQWEARLGDDGMLGYYPTVSTFKGGMVQVNFGPDFDFPVEGTRPMSDRYDEMIAEDVTQDVIDEVDFELQAIEAKIQQEEEAEAENKRDPKPSLKKEDSNGPPSNSEHGGNGNNNGNSPPQPSRRDSDDEPISVAGIPTIPVNHADEFSLVASTGPALHTPIALVGPADHVSPPQGLYMAQNMQRMSEFEQESVLPNGVREPPIVLRPFMNGLAPALQLAAAEREPMAPGSESLLPTAIMEAPEPAS